MFLKNGMLSLVTDEQEAHFRTARLREIVMSSQDAGLALTFSFDDPQSGSAVDVEEDIRSPDMPEYVVVTDSNLPAPPPIAPFAPIAPIAPSLNEGSLQ